jgi:hypothetical protein
MILEKARELLSVQAYMGGGYNRNGARLILAEVQREHGLGAVDGYIREFDLQTLSGFKPGTELHHLNGSIESDPLIHKLENHHVY